MITFEIHKYVLVSVIFAIVALSAGIYALIYHLVCRTRARDKKLWMMDDRLDTLEHNVTMLDYGKEKLHEKVLKLSHDFASLEEHVHTWLNYGKEEGKEEDAEPNKKLADDIASAILSGIDKAINGGK